MGGNTWYLRTANETFGPETKQRLLEWARLGRIQPGQEISEDCVNWRAAVSVPFLDMRFSIDIGDGRPRGPFNREAATSLLRSGRLPPGSKLVEVRPPFTDGEREDAAQPADGATRSLKGSDPDRVNGSVKIVEKRVEVPVEKIVEKRVEVPVETIVEKVVEKIVEVRDPALEAELQDAKNAADAARRETADAKAEALALSGEIERLPSNARSAANTEAAVYALMREEAADLAELIERERKEAEASRRRAQERIDRLIARQRELLKRIGDSEDDMTRRALRAHPEDPRTTNMRRELDAMRLIQEKSAREAEARIRDLTDKYGEARTEAERLRGKAADMAILMRQVHDLRERLQLRERDLLAFKRAADEERQQHEISQQTLLKRLSELEQGLPGRTLQSREAHSVKFAPWMGFKK